MALATSHRPKWEALMDASAAKYRQREAAPAIRRYVSNTERRRAITACFSAWLDELDDTSITGRRRMVVRLGQALLVEDNRRRSGHWAYSPPRHRHMLAVYKRELLDLNALLDARSFEWRAA